SVRAGPDDVTGVVEDGVVEKRGRDKGEERDDEQDADDERESSFWVARRAWSGELGMFWGLDGVPHGFSSGLTLYAYGVRYTYGVRLSSMPVRTRRPLSRDRVLQAALKLADAGGFGAISMRNVAKELGVEAMSLYNHV